MQTTNSKLHIELMRIFACYMVLFNHTAYSIREIAPNDLSKSRIITLILYFICKSAVPLFLLIAGANLIQRKDTISKYIKRILKILYLIFISSIIYAIHDQIPIFSTYFWSDLYYGNQNAAIWYLYLYLCLLILLPLLQNLHLSSKQYIYLLVIYLIGPGLFPILRTYFSVSAPAAALFSAFPSAYIVLFLLGDYLENHIDIWNQKRYFPLLIFSGLSATLLISLFLALYQLNATGKIDYNALYGTNYYSLTIIISICIYILFKYFSPKLSSPFIQKIIYSLGKYTLGIYILGELLRSKLEPFYDTIKERISSLLAVLIYSTCIFILGALIMHIFYIIKRGILILIKKIR